MPFALRLFLALAPKDKALFVGLACLLTPVLLLCLFFSGPVVIHERVPMATPEQAWLYFNAAKEVGDGTKSPCHDGVTVNWQQVIAVDAVRLKQDFSKTSMTRALDLAGMFIEQTGTCKHCVSDGDGGVTCTTYPVFRLRTLEEVCSLLGMGVEDIEAEETMLHMAPNTVLRHVKFLVEKGWLDERHNPNHKWDRTKQYRVNLLKIHKDLVEIGYTLQDYKVEVPFSKIENAFSKMENGSSKTENGISEMENRTLQNGKAIPEITTENKSIHSSIHHKDDDRARVKRILTGAGFEGSKVEVEFLTRWFPVFPPEMIEYAFRKAVLNGKKSLTYIGGIFESWAEKGVKTVAQAERETRYDFILKAAMEKDNKRDPGRELNCRIRRCSGNTLIGMAEFLLNCIFFAIKLLILVVQAF